MTVVYGTILDSKFLPQGLALYRSFEREVSEGRFYFFAMDAEAETLLAKIVLPRGRVVPAAAIRHPALEAQRSWRSFPEYCWATKPLAIAYMLAHDEEAEWAVYLDSDMAFFADPAAAFRCARHNVLGFFTPHRFNPGMESWPARVGRHNGGFGAFRKRAESGAILDRWLRDCLARPDKAARKGETFDQKILDDIVASEGGVLSLDDPGINLAPWNIDNYRIADSGGKPSVDGQPVSIYHFQSLRMHSAGFYTLYNSNRPITGALRRSIYWPYVYLLRAALRELKAVDPGYRPLTHPFARNWRNLLRILAETVLGRRSVVAVWS